MGSPTPRRSLADALRAVDAAPVRSQDDDGGALVTRPTLQDRLDALEPVEPVRLTPSSASARPRALSVSLQAPSGLMSPWPGTAIAAGAHETLTTLVPASQSARLRRSAVSRTAT